MAYERDLLADCNALDEPLLDRESCEERPSAGSSRRAPPPSRNIALTLLFTALAFAGRSLWSQSVLSSFIYLLSNSDPKMVGFISACMGGFQLVASLPAGIVADKYRRDRLLKIASIVGILAIGLTYTAVLVKQTFLWLGLGLSVWGLFWGITNTSMGALFADSIPDGQRSKYFTQRSILLKLGTTAGPLTALIMFAFLGNEWNLRDCAIVMAVGNGICIPAIIVLCFLSDDHAVHEEDNQELDDDNLNHPLVVRDGDEGHDDEGDVFHMCLPESRVIPILVAFADVLAGLGSGMSIRYFPIFFLDNLQLTPVVVQIMYVFSPLGQAILMKCGQQTSKSIGRCHTAVLFKWAGIFFMILMIMSHHCKLPKWLTCVFFVLRTSFMDATSPLTKSVLMDAVPKQERGKWSALESVNMFGWSGSAVLGGILVGTKGIMFNFEVTASIQFLATLPLLALLSRDHMEGGASSHSTSSSTAADDESDSCASDETNA